MMEYIALAKKVYAMAKEVKQYIEVDQNCRIVILEEFNAGEFLVEVPDFKCDDFIIENNFMRIYATGSRAPLCDGASLVPDEIKGFSALISSIVHDLLYAHMEEIAVAWNWEVGEVRKLADDVFGNDLKARNKGWLGKLLSRVYYWGVRVFGGIYHNAKRASLLLLCLMSLTALGGDNALVRITELGTIKEPPSWLKNYEVIEQGIYEATNTSRRVIASITRKGKTIKFPKPVRYTYRIIHSNGKVYFCDSYSNWLLLEKEN